ncbi:methyltransferase family protein [Sediminitomix flava]|uniref:Methyltransferase family protein n=2 Tax=Sediminitomix flava TaxID=379075 RepID=A0A315ZDH6_SEDFL|nr:methyltransferase family protein [Sediminitomix flava]
MEISQFKKFANLIGLDQGEDIDEIYDEISKADRVLELGSGYGRVIEVLRRKGFKGVISGVERSLKLREYVQNTFNEDVRLFKELPLELNEKFDAILYVWSGILEQERDIQKDIVKQCAELLDEGGKLLIETPFKEIKKLGDLKEDTKTIRVKEEWGTLSAYFTSAQDIEEYAKEAGFKNIREVYYHTRTNLSRIFYILQK